MRTRGPDWRIQPRNPGFPLLTPQPENRGSRAPRHEVAVTIPTVTLTPPRQYQSTEAVG